MNRLKFALSVVAAITGVGAAYVSNANPFKAQPTTYKWHTFGTNKTTVFTGTTVGARALCSGNSGNCLRGTSASGTVTLIGSYTGGAL